MDVQRKEKKILQWHPAFFAGIQIELQEEEDNLIFENEHQLGTKPKEVDILVIKKEKDKPIKKNIGRIFRKHNIIEYKCPGDYMSINDFYKVYGYTCFYKSDTQKQNEILISEITITLASESYPRTLINHLQKERGYKVEMADKGIFYIKGDLIPIQIIVTKQLSEAENLWLRGLTNKMKDEKLPENLIDEYGKHKDNILYQSVMDIIVNANKEKFEEEGHMCEALMEIAREKLKDEFEAREQAGKTLSLIKLVCKKIQKNMSVSEIADMLEEDESVIQKIYDAAVRYAPDYDVEKIYEELK